MLDATEIKKIANFTKLANLPILIGPLYKSSVSIGLCLVLLNVQVAFCRLLCLIIIPCQTMD